MYICLYIYIRKIKVSVYQIGNVPLLMSCMAVYFEYCNERILHPSPACIQTSPKAREH